MADLGGRPPYWTDVEAFDKAVDEYFEKEAIPTWTGLALHLGFSSRDSLNDYKKKDGFSDSVKKALLRIEQKYEFSLYGKNPTGAIFALKNFGWKDRHEVDQKTTIEDNRIDESKLSDEELRTLAEIQRKGGFSQT